MQEVKLETYKKAIVCGNCSERFEVEIPKGVRITDFCEALRCPNCGCGAKDSPRIYFCLA